MQAWIYGQARDLGSQFDDYAVPKGTAILSIDMHRGHLDDDPQCPCPAPRAREIVAPINRFHRSARALGVPIIHVTSTLRADGADDLRGIPAGWRRTFPLHVGPIPNADGHALEGSRWTELVTEVEPQDWRVASKKRLSAFTHTDLDFLLRNQRIHTVVIDGGFADCCVLNTAFDANNHLYKVVVLRDLVRGTDCALEDAAMAMVSLHLGLVLNSEELLKRWQSAVNAC
jgi:nicotinamidase-related amidase